jgi:uncharacterized YigZ family protein
MAPILRTIAHGGQHEIEILKSRFICTVERVTDETEAKALLEGLRKRYWDANHNCYAYIIGELGMAQKASDDGEPSGTAGVPMLEVLRKRQITDVLAVVTRYFGGTKLGAGGLIRAYGRSVSETIDAVGIVERRPLAILEISTDYTTAGRLEYAFHGSPYSTSDIRYGADVTFVTHLERADIPSLETWLAEQTNGAVHATVTGEAIVEVPAPLHVEPAAG